MPNWCENHLTIRVNTDVYTVDDVCRALEGPDNVPYYIRERERKTMTNIKFDDTGHIIPETSTLSFHKLVPLPKDIIESENPDHIPTIKFDEFHPASDYWGTKWPPSNVTRNIHDNVIIFMFSTAWGPPFPVIDAIAKLFPDNGIEFVYAEPGMLFAGERIYRDGFIESEDIVDNEEDFIDFITNHEELGFDPADFIDYDDED